MQISIMGDVFDAELIAEAVDMSDETARGYFLIKTENGDRVRLPMRFTLLAQKEINESKRCIRAVQFQMELRSDKE